MNTKDFVKADWQLLKGIGIVTVFTIALVFLNYTWINTYGRCLGISSLASDYGYPEILFPRGSVLTIMLLTLLGYKYRSFYDSYKHIVKQAFIDIHNITTDPSFLQKYAFRKSKFDRKKINLSLFAGKFYQLMKRDGKKAEELIGDGDVLFPDLTKEQKIDFLRYCYVMFEASNRLDLIESVSGTPPRTPAVYLWFIGIAALVQCSLLLTQRFSWLAMGMGIFILASSWSLGYGSHAVINHINRFRAWYFMYCIGGLIILLIVCDAIYSGYMFSRSNQEKTFSLVMNNGEAVEGILLEMSPHSYYLYDVNDPKQITRVNANMVKQAITTSDGSFISIFHRRPRTYYEKLSGQTRDGK